MYERERLEPTATRDLIEELISVWSPFFGVQGRLAVGLDRSRAPVCCLEGPFELDQGGL